MHGRPIPVNKMWNDLNKKVDWSKLPIERCPLPLIDDVWINSSATESTYSCPVPQQKYLDFLTQYANLLADNHMFSRMAREHFRDLGYLTKAEAKFAGRCFGGSWMSVSAKQQSIERSLTLHDQKLFVGQMHVVFHNGRRFENYLVELLDMAHLPVEFFVELIRRFGFEPRHINVSPKKLNQITTMLNTPQVPY